MSQATTAQLPVPLLEHIGRDLLVLPTDGRAALHLPYYFPDVPQTTIQHMLAGINCNIALTVDEDGRVVANGTEGADVMLGNDSQRYFAGQGGNDVIVARAADARIIGGDGDDYLIGGVGNDVITGGDGADRIYGAAGRNVLLGGAGDDWIIGGTGDDHLHGEEGDDFLIGLQGDDSYYMSKGGGHDRVLNRDETGTDILYLNDVDAEQLWFRRIGNDLEVRLIETGDSVTLDAWYERPAQRVDKIVVSSASGDETQKVLLKDQVEHLVQAMAAFESPPLGSTALPASCQATLAPVLAANWQQV